MLSPASPTTAAPEAGDGSPAWARDIKCTALLWGLLCTPGWKVPPKALWGIPGCPRMVFLSWQETLALELAHSSQRESWPAATQKLCFKLLPQIQGRKGFFLFWPVMKTKGKWGSHFHDLGRNLTIHSNRMGVF